MTPPRPDQPAMTDSEQTIVAIRASIREGCCCSGCHDRGVLLAEVDRLKGERDQWKKQHDRVLSQAQRDFDRGHMADQYEQWLLDLGRISGCGHVDERLPRCVEEVFEAERSRYTELVDALCSKSWARRNDHASVVALAVRLVALQQKIVARDVDERMEAQQAMYEMGIESENDDG